MLEDKIDINMMKGERKGCLRWIWLSILVLIVDQIIKYWAMKTLILYQPKPILPFFNLTLSYNTGAAFSFLREAGGWQQWLFGGLAITVSLLILVWLARLNKNKRCLAIALTLILGGALSNLYDRITLGYVVDLFDFYYKNWHYPVFNIADTAICVGAGLMAIDMLFFSQSKTKRKSQ